MEGYTTDCHFPKSPQYLYASGWLAGALRFTPIEHRPLTTSSRAINGILAMNEFKERFGTCKDQPDRDDICAKDSALIVAILSVGTAIGALLAAPAGDMLGRRRSMLLAVGIFCIGAICQVCAEALPALLVGRWVFCSITNAILSTKALIRTWRARCSKLCNITDLF